MQFKFFRKIIFIVLYFCVRANLANLIIQEDNDCYNKEYPHFYPILHISIFANEKRIMEPSCLSIRPSSVSLSICILPTTQPIRTNLKESLGVFALSIIRFQPRIKHRRLYRSRLTGLHLPTFCLPTYFL